MKDLSRVIHRPLITERGSSLRTKYNKYFFEVEPRANKHEIKQAVELYFGVKVESVRTMTMRGKVKRLGRFAGKRPDWKKAVVTLAEGDTIDIFDNV